MKFLNLVILSGVFSSVFASTNDVKPRSLRPGDPYVKVERVTEDLTKFEQCLWQRENTCQTLGNKDSYTVEELQSQRTQENWEILGSGAGLVAGGFVGGIIGPLGLGTLIGTAETAGFFAIFFGAPAGMVLTPLALSQFTDSFNPATQYRQATALNSDVIYDKEVRVKNIKRFITRLHLVLSKID